MPLENLTSVLFLTTQDPAEIKPEWPYYQNWTLPKTIEEHGAAVSIRGWQEPSLNAEALAAFDIITFLWCNNYHNHAAPFTSFLRDVLKPAQRMSPGLRVVNDTDIILWNIDKQVYLPELARDGFLVPETIFLDEIRTSDGSTAEVEKKVASFACHGKPVVLKPSISGSSKQTHLIRNPAELNSEDVKYLQSIVQKGVDGSLMIQRYESGIVTGEYSMVFIGGKHTHTMLKTPRHGEFRCQHEFGAGIAEISRQDVPAKAIEEATKIVQSLERKFRPVSAVVSQKPSLEETVVSLLRQKFIAVTKYLRQILTSWIGSRWLPVEKEKEVQSSESGMAYIRVDGVMREDGNFVLMEVEAIEPHLWLETAVTPGCKEALYKALLGSKL